jgi:biopolymer transport protein ExbD
MKMLSNSVLKQSRLESPLKSLSRLKPKGSKASKPLVFSLMLTSLVDAFAILLIFLLLNNSDSDPRIQLSKDIRLPEVTQSTNLDYGIIVKIENGRYFVEEKEVATNDLPKFLIQHKDKFTQDKSNKDHGKKAQLIVQADRGASFQILNPVVLAASHAGFENFKFAVLPKESK